MAAGAYKGLTIRIGADTTKLSSALRGADSAIHKTQTQLNNLAKAAKIDPGNKDIASKQIGALASQATAAAREMAVLQKGMADLAKMSVVGDNNSAKTVGELAKNTESVTLAARDAERAYDDVNKKINDVYSSIKEANPDVALADLRKITNEGFFDESVLQKLVDSKKITQEQADKVRELKDEWTSARNELDNYANAEKLDQLRTKAEILGVSFKKMVADIKDANMSLRSASTEQFGQSLETTNSKLALLEAASQTAMQRFRMLDQALKLDPSNIELSDQRATALAEAMEVASRHAETLRDKISHYETGDMTAQAQGVKDVALNLEQAKQKYSEAEQRVAELVVEQAKLAESANVASTSMSEMAESGEQLEGVSRSAEDVAKELEEARQAAADAFKEMDTAKAIAEHQSLVDQLRQEDATLDSLKTSFGSLRVQSNIAANFKDLNEQMRLVSAGADTAKNRFDQLNNASKIQPYSLQIAVEKVRALREATDAARQKAEVLKQKLEAYKSAGVDRMSRQITDSAVAFEKANQRVKELQAALKQAAHDEGEASDKAKDLADQLAKAQASAKTMGAINEYRNLEAELRQVQSASKEMQASMKADLGEVGAAAVTAAQQLSQMAEQAWGKISQSANDVDASYRDLRKTFDTTDESAYQHLYDAAMEYSQTHTTAAKDMLEMEAIAAQLGVGLDGGADALERFATVAANLDVATDIDSDTIALQMGQTMAVMEDLRTDNIDKFGDALVRLGNNMPTQESNIMQITQRLSAVGNIAGFSTPQLLGWAAAVASTGQKSEAAATGLSNLITKITAAVDDFDKGGDSLEKYAKVAGVSAEQFAKDWREGPSEALEGLISKLGDSETLFSDLAGMDITSVRQTQTVAALSQTVGKLGDATRMASDAFNGIDDEFGDAGDAAREAEKKAEGFSGSLAKLNNSVDVLAASFGPAFVGVLDMVADKVQWLTDVVSGWSDDFKQNIIIAAGSLVAFTTGWNFLKPLADSMFKFGSGAVQFVIGQLAELKVALELGKGGLGATTIGMKLGGLATKLMSLSTWAGLAGGALAVLGISAAVYFGAKAIKAKRDADKFNNALEGISGTTEGLAADLIAGSNGVSRFGSSWRDAKVDIDRFVAAMEEHNEIQSDTRTEAAESIGLLEKYKSVIDKAAGAGDGYTGSVAELKVAVDGLNEMLGTNYDYNDILKGSYEDAEGATKSYREEIDRLIEAKKKELRVNALSEMYTEDLKMLEKSKKAYSDARKARREYVANYVEENKDTKFYNGNTRQWETRDHDTLVNMAHQTDEYKELDSAVDKTREATRGYADDLKYLDGQLNGALEEARYAEEGFTGVREGIILNSEAMYDAIAASGKFGETEEEVGGKIKELAKRLMDAKVGTKEFADMAQNHPDVFAGMVEKANGDMDTLVNLISEWNMAELEEKFAGFTYDGTGFVNAEGDRYDWNGTDWEFKEAGVKVDTSQIDDAKDKKDELKGDVTFGINVKDDGARSLLDNLSNTKLDAVTMKFQAEDGGVTSMYDMLQSMTGKTILTKFKADATEIEDAQNITDSLQDEDVFVNLKMGDTDWLGEFSDLIGSLPTNVTTTLTAQTIGVNAASRSIDLLNISAGGMHDVYANYVAGGNAATSSDPSNKIRGVTGAASGLISKDTWYRVYGNALDQRTADAIWNVVAAANNLVSKTVDITTNAIKNVITNVVNSATGAYLPYNKIPRHAAGIFTRPTLTNIGWVGEDGAELYSGNSLVPLTNRKYSMPYIDDISTAVARKLGAQSTGIDYDLLGQSVAAALVGMSVTIDGQALVGEIATQVQRTSRLYAG